MPFLLPLLALVTGVGKTDPVAKPDRSEPTAQTSTATGTQTPQKAALRAAGLCPDAGDIQGIQTTRLANGRALLEVQCAMFAYQGAYAFAWAESGQPLRDQDGEILHLVGLPDLAPDGPDQPERARGRGVRPCPVCREGERFVQGAPGPGVDTGPDAPTRAVAAGRRGRRTSHCAPDETVYFSVRPPGRRWSRCGSGDCSTASGQLTRRSSASRRQPPRGLHHRASVHPAVRGGHRDLPHRRGDLRGRRGPRCRRAERGDEPLAGVTVRRGDDLLARIPCTGTVTSVKTLPSGRRGRRSVVRGWRHPRATRAPHPVVLAHPPRTAVG